MKDRVLMEKMDVRYCPTEQKADVFTKPLQARSIVQVFPKGNSNGIRSYIRSLACQFIGD